MQHAAVFSRVIAKQPFALNCGKAKLNCGTKIETFRKKRIGPRHGAEQLKYVVTQCVIPIHWEKVEL